VHEIHLNLGIPEQQHYFKINMKGGLRQVNVSEMEEKKIRIE
jgi:hypothetical protein